MGEVFVGFDDSFFFDLELFGVVEYLELVVGVFGEVFVLDVVVVVEGRGVDYRNEVGDGVGFFVVVGFDCDYIFWNGEWDDIDVIRVFYFC